MREVRIGRGKGMTQDCERNFTSATSMSRKYWTTVIAIVNGHVICYKGATGNYYPKNSAVVARHSEIYDPKNVTDEKTVLVLL